MDILSVKIVTVDYFNQSPIPNLDLTYSEFRKKQIKSVPIIRIFGLRKNKKKICCNVHNVFPYLFVPCSEVDHKKAEGIMKTMAEQIDEKINASLGQANSTQHYVHKISICKGIPYYGYHSNESQFFRIELYNPNLLKRTAGLFQSGCILGKMLQPHESHIPFILRFFIDFNLFGMSHLHVPLNKVHTRLSTSDGKYKKRSVSHVEVDFSAAYIMNRSTLNACEDKQKASNIGIESLWEDERRRRLAEDMSEPLNIPEEEKRQCNITPSDFFFQRALKERFFHSSQNETLNESIINQIIVKKKFDLKNFIDSSTYGVEFTQNSSSSKEEQFDSDLTLSSKESQTIEEMERYILAAYKEDESDDQNEESETFNDHEKEKSDLNRTILHLTQSLRNASSDIATNNLNDDQIQNAVDDDDDEDESEFNMTLADLEAAFLGNNDEAMEIPQLDGNDDELEKLEPTPSSSKTVLPHIQSSLNNLAHHFTRSQNEENATYSDSDNENDEMIKSFYNESQFYDFEEDSDTEMIEEEEECNAPSSDAMIISSLIDPPDSSTVLNNLDKYGIPSTLNKSAYYSNPLDVTERKEIGNNILEIKSDRLNDCDDFKSLLFDSNQLDFFRNEKISYDLGFSMKNLTNVVDLMVNNSNVTIFPSQIPPNYEDAKKWLQSYNEENAIEPVNPDQESPIKIKREKTIMMLEYAEENLDETLIPQTPDYKNVSLIQSSVEKESPSLDDFIEDGIYLSFSKRMKRKRKIKQSFSKRFQEIMKAKTSLRSATTSKEENSAPDSPLTEFSDSSDDFIRTPKEEDKLTDSLSPSIIQDANLPLYESCESSTFNNSFEFKMKLESLHSTDEHNDITILTMELHVQTKDEFNPNPETDKISAIFYSVEGFYVNEQAISLNGMIVVVCDNADLGFFKENVEIIKVKNEMELLNEFLKKIRLFDPDIFSGYEIELLSWGFLIERGYVLNMNLCNALSRVPLDKEYKAKNIHEDDDHDKGDYYSEQRITGRILLDIWRILKNEIALTSYSFENISYHLLHRRYPKHSYSFLSSMWSQPLRRWIVLEYYFNRTKTLLEILNQLDLIGRTCELAKLFGIQFFEVLSRGSQFRVESMMLRIAKSKHNFVAVSPSIQQRTHMRAPEYLPLILEPESRFYTDPVIVLDFQSLYPSIIIAYNYCFSTCLGRVEHLLKCSQQPFEFGAYQLKISPSRLEFLLSNDLVTVSPCGVAFVKSNAREGVLPRMLKEILDTRLMVKQSMKLHKNNTALQRVLHSRQLGLKLIANVTYGYTAANFSGRMPASEVGDSVVSKAREALERAISMVESNEKWKCKVCYGDTDSMFVLVPGRTREEAFKIGEEIAEAVTNDNPFPIKLKLEKVYQPCILQTKKRYVGYMYENCDQKEPIFEAKGIETVRRDGCPASSKILEKSLKILFDTYDVSRVKEYVCKQFTKILEGKFNIQDLIIAKEFRGISGYKERAVVPALTLTKKFKTSDPRNEPRRGERVPFLLVNGPPNSILIRLVKTPLEVLNDENLKINSLYYITKAIIPPLNRCLLLIGANANDWFAELPKKHQSLQIVNSSLNDFARKGTISQFFNSTNCVICEHQCEENLCDDCRANPQASALILTDKIYEIENKYFGVRQMCQACCARNFNFKCISLDCPTLYSLSKINRDYQQLIHYRNILSEII